MLKAFLRLFFIALASLIWLVLVVLSLRFLAGQPQYAPADHPLLGRPNWQILDLLKSNPSTLPPSKDLILLARLYLSREGQWVVSTQSYLPTTFQPLNSLSNEELKAAGISSLASWVEQHRDFYFLFQIEDSAAQALDQISELVAKFDLKERVLITSRYSSVLTKMREREPLWLYGASTSEISRLRFLSAIYLEPIVSLQSDFLILDRWPNERMRNEIKRRHKKFIFQISSEKIDAELIQKTDGILAQTVEQLSLED